MHNIFGQRFYSRVKPWHALGLISDVEMSALEALEAVGTYNVELWPLTANSPVEDDKFLATDYRAIVRYPTQDDERYRVYGTVKPEYNLITPRQLCQLWDEHVAKPVETLGSLGQGEKAGSTLFVTTYLPKFDLKGDQIEFYLLLVSPMTGTEAAIVSIVTNRVVCQNTLNAALSTATQTWKFIHDRAAKVRLGKALTQVYSWAEEETLLLKNTFTKLSTVPVTDLQAKRVIDYAYKLRSEPRIALDDLTNDQRNEKFEARKEAIARRRETAFELYQGAGTGLDLASCKTDTGAPNLWKVLNAVIETEDYRRGHGERAMSLDVLFGRRDATKKRALTKCLEYAKS